MKTDLSVLSPRAVADLPHLLTLPHSYVSSFLAMNHYTRMVVCRHHHNEPGYQVWLMGSGDFGTYTTYRTKRDAMKYARMLAAPHNLPIEIE